MKFDPAVQQYLKDIQIPIRLSSLDDSGWPVVLSLWFLYEERMFYCATPQRAKVVSYLELEPRCAFEIASDQPPYCGVRGRAVATLDQEKGLEVLEQLSKKYLGGVNNPLAAKLLSRPQPEVAIRLEPKTIHTWNFSSRMKNSLAQVAPMPCPN